MRELRHGEQRDQPHLPFRRVPIRPEQPVPLMPDAAAPEQLLDVSESPKRREKDQPVVRKRSVNSIARLAARLGVEPEQSEVRYTVDDHVRDGEGVIGIERYEPDVPAYGGGRDDDVLTGIKETR